MASVEQIVDFAEQGCKSRGTRFTTKRKQVLQGLLQTEKALSAYELIDTYETLFDEKLAAMSVYRILDFLEQEGLVHRLKMANKYVACKHAACNHEHAVSQFLICSQCQKVEEIGINKETMRDIENSVASAGFNLVGSQFELNCICNNCASLDGSER